VSDERQMHLVDEAAIDMLESYARPLRDAWLTRRTMCVALAERCEIPFVVGRVSAVAVTGSWATVDGWHVPLDQVRDVHPAAPAEVAGYAQYMHQLRERAQ
jgi:hypothetical protein